MNYGNTQTKSTEQGRETPVPVGSGVELTGATRPSSNDCRNNKPEVENQAAGIVITTGTEGKIVKKGRRDSMGHSLIKGVYPLQRSFSAGDAERTETVPPLTPHSRKRKERTEDEIYRKRLNPTMVDLIDNLAYLSSKLKQLNGMVQVNTNTKKEIKEVNAELHRVNARLNKDTIKSMLEEMKYEKTEQMMIEVDTQTDVETEVSHEDRFCTPKTKMVDAETQTDSKQQSKSVVTEIDLLDTYDKWQEKGDLRWDDKIYTNTEIEIGNPIKAKDTVIKVVTVEKEDQQMEQGIQRIFKDRYPELKACTEDFQIFEQHTRIRSQNKNEEVGKRTVVKIRLNGTEEDLWDKLMKLKEETTKDEIIAIHELNFIKTKRLRKMAESIFHDSGRNILIYVPKANLRPKKENTSRDGRETKTVIVRLEDNDTQSYSSVLKNMQKNIDLDKLNVQVRNINRSKTGEIRIKVKSAKDNGTQDFKNAIMNGGFGKLEIYEERKNIIVKDIDELTEPEDIAQGILTTLNKTDITVDVKNLKKTRANVQMAIVTVPLTDANRLLEKRRIKIGWSSCRIEEFINPRRCFKCLGFGHLAADCCNKESGIRDECLRCGSKEHRAKTCDSEVFKCYVCQIEGHRADTMACPSYRKVVDKIRKERAAQREGKTNDL